MKYIPLFLLIFCIWSQGYGFEESKVKPSEKTYIQPNQISLSPSGIHVYTRSNSMASKRTTFKAFEIE